MKMRLPWHMIFSLIFCFVAPLFALEEARANKPVKLLVVIIASDGFPVYTELQKIWRSYMHLDPEHVEVYFMKGDPHLPNLCEIRGDEIWVRTEESIIPGLINKTIISLDTLWPRVQTEFDYVLRTNLSSFYHFPRLLQFLQNAPRTNFYCGTDIGSPGIASGCGFLMSPDIARMLIDNKNYFINNRAAEDDVIMGRFFRDRGVRLRPHARMDFFTMQDWYRQKDHIPTDFFHFRIKNDHNVRLTDDVYIQTQLRNMFYS